MYARITTLETTAEQFDEGLRIVREDLLPWAQHSVGYRGLIGLDSRDEGRTLVLTLWATAEALEASRDAADRLTAGASEVAGANRTTISHYEIALLDLPVAARA
ncbi:MAG TPA: hypothetical protein VLB86_10275 [Gaiellaceae bacterium]|nr:hypothetical protein [Gaiellaceae bacterium]